LLKLSQNKSKRLSIGIHASNTGSEYIDVPEAELAGIIRLKLLENPDLEIDDPTDFEDEEEILSRRR